MVSDLKSGTNEDDKDSVPECDDEAWTEWSQHQDDPGCLGLPPAPGALYINSQLRIIHILIRYSCIRLVEELL